MLTKIISITLKRKACFIYYCVQFSTGASACETDIPARPSDQKARPLLNTFKLNFITIKRKTQSVRKCGRCERERFEGKFLN